MHRNARRCPIAIVGMACRYPDANTADRLFENSLAQRRSFRRIPEGRLAPGYFDEAGRARDRAYARQAAVLDGFDFDLERFRVSRSSYEVTDLTHWLALTVARETIEGIRFRKHGSRVGNEAVRVVVGNTLTGEFSRASLMRLRWPYVRGVVAQLLRDMDPGLDDDERSRLLRELEERYKRPFPAPNEDFLAGGLANTIAGRICNHFDFKGGGYTIDGACSSSLLAVIDACSALVSGDADMVLAGGVDLSLDPFELVGFSRTMALARNEMRVYDEQSEGFWPGEGCGFVALMRHEDALEQCEHIHAVIQGWGMSSDGRGGLTRPEVSGQSLALQRCYQRAGYGIESVGYFEGHGTGTKVGDAVELRALITARSDSGHPIQPATIASIKANIGHTKAAAGLAGLLRAAKCVSEKVLPPTTACRKPHPLFADSVGNLAPGDRIRSWQSGQVARRAGISAMGFGGINTHVTIEEAPAAARTAIAVPGHHDLARLSTFQETELFLFSASRREDLAWTIDHLAGFVDQCSRAELTDLAVELARRATRGALATWKAAVVATTPAELARKLGRLKETLASADDDVVHLAMSNGIFLSGGNRRGRIGLVFPGQGVSVREQGGIHARRFDEVQRVYEQASLDSFTARDDTDFAQLAIVAASLGGLEMLRRIGTSGDVAVGHSLGELIALHWAGCCDAATLLELVRERGRVMVDDASSAGAMAAIAMDRDRTAAAIGAQENLFVANIVSSRQTVVAGGREEILALVARIRRTGVGAMVLGHRQAFHTPLMAGAAAGFKAALDGVCFRAAERKVISTVTGRPVAADVDLADHLRVQMTSPVHFMTATRLAAQEVDLLIDVSPGELMATLARGVCEVPVVSIDVGGESLAPFLRTAGAAYVLGCTPTIANLFTDRFARRFAWSWRPKFLVNPCEAIPAEPLPAQEIESSVVAGETAPDPPSATDGDAGGSTRDILRQMVAHRTGLPTWVIQDNSRMLSDLHLNSITVGEIVASVAVARGLQPPVDSTEYANASVEEVAAALDRLQRSGAGEQAGRPAVPSGLDSWVRYFEMSRVPAPRRDRRHDLAPGKWEGFGVLAQQEQALLQRLDSEPHGSGTIVWLGDVPDTRGFPSLLKAAQRCIERAQQSGERSCFVIVDRGWAASGFARSFFLENETISTLVIELAAREHDDPTEWILQEIDAARPGFSEIFIDATGQREEPRLRLLRVPPALSLPSSDQTSRREPGEQAPERPVYPIDGSDVVLVTGGGKGISAECGYQLARRTGCALLILGRSGPQDSVELATNLERLRQAELQMSYQLADVTDAADVAAAIARGVAEIGAPVTGVIHGAGLNHPRMVTNLSIVGLEATVSPKVDGLRNLLAAIDPDRLKLLVSFSSIIARIGLQGEADYALANEWLSRETEAFQARHPRCRCRAIEWSVWSGTGMGQRLGRLDALIAQGISPISIDDGVREFLRSIETPGLPTRVIVSGRFGSPATVVMDPVPSRRFRFIDSIAVYYPETELIAECRLSSKSDPYLDDHRLNGERLFPAVMALEAMSEAALTLMQKDAGAVTLLFHDVEFRKAIVVPEAQDAEPFILRLTVLASAGGEISVAIRCSTTDFRVNHVEARCTLQSKASFEIAGSEIEPLSGDEIQPFDPDSALYRNVLFQDGRFKRIHGYHLIEARRCSGQLAPDGAARWFSRDLPQDLLLGDPGARDAALHAIQACIPHKIVIPISVEAIDSSALDPCQPHRMFATEIADRGDELLYNLTVFDRDGRAIERWRHLVLRIVGEPPSLQLDSPFLMAPFFERRVAAVLPRADLKVSIAPTSDPQSKRTATVSPHHRPDGKPDPSSDSRFPSAAYSGDWRLAVDSAVPVGCDLQSVSTRDVGEWELLLGKECLGLAKVVAGITQEQLDVSATRVWTTREAMKKAGLAVSAPLTVDPDSLAQWVVFRSGDSTIFSSLIDSPAPGAAICITVALLQSR